MPPDRHQTWTAIEDRLRRCIDPSTYDIWLAPLTPRECTADHLLVAAPDATRSWIAERFGSLLSATATAVVGHPVAVEVVPASHPAGAHAPAPAAAPTDQERFNPKLTFDQFVIGGGNRLAHAAALAVAELPGHTYNPLFLCGPPGVGKTHLLHSIANYVHAFSPGITVRYTTTEAFTTEFVGAIQRRHDASLDAFKRRYRDADVLLVDDVQFLIHKTHTEEELLHTFNTLYDTGAQLVVTSDRRPDDLDTLQGRLRERLGSGLVGEIAAPDLATRLAILHKRSHLDAIELDDPTALEVIARHAGPTIRSLEAAFIRVVALHSLTQRPIDATLAHEALPTTDHETHSHGAGSPSLATIQSVVADTFGVTVAELCSADRSARTAWPRQVAMHIARTVTEHSLLEIAMAFQRRNHTTVLHASRRVVKRTAGDPRASQLVHTATARVNDPADDRSP